MFQNQQNNTELDRPTDVAATLIRLQCLPKRRVHLRVCVLQYRFADDDELRCFDASIQLQLRCLIHMELAKCEEDAEHLSVAVEHVEKV